ncbi:oligopeptide transporter 5-like isoform X3 [Syzygium oleosum]|uniref:oligopeptide transporter 5-like isoform X3 n=1 Tax=Syzygium oleosum TaxID=219896 RepID=UPI0024BA89A9|nr:oligopeptide transporter 5-like isoform X3 [Syzygium oleosum]
MEQPYDDSGVPLSYQPEKLEPYNHNLENSDEVNDSPIEEVRLTVSIKDDPTLPCLTFRTWFLGITACAALSFLNQFFSFRQNSLSLTSVSAQIAVLPLGKFMAAVLPKKAVRIPGTKWSFSLNPGPFNLKEHVLITIFANAGSNGVYAINIVTIVMAFYHRHIHPLAAMLLTLTTQMLGYGWAGIFRKFLVDSPYMWWPANLVQVSLFRIIWQQTKATFRDKFDDVHTRLMKKNYDAVPQWWFYSLSLIMIGLAMVACEGFGGQLQLPFWGVMLAIGIVLFFMLPIGVITATTNQQPGLNVISELIIGYLYPGRPLANVVFKTYGYVSLVQAITFLSDFKLGHYMKIPPKSMFIVQLVGTVVASSVYFGTAWWLLTSMDHLCHPSKLPVGSQWTCPGYNVFYNASIIWGVVGPLRMFGRLGLYVKMNYFFLIGLLAPVPVWILSRMFPEKKWVRLINMPIIISGAGNMLQATVVNYICWITIGVFFNIYVYRRYQSWWARHNYILSSGLDAGVAFMAILCYFTLQIRDINGMRWWGLELDDHCPLASCPTAPGIQVKDCPIFH